MQRGEKRVVAIPGLANCSFNSPMAPLTSPIVGQIQCRIRG